MSYTVGSAINAGFVAVNVDDVTAQTQDGANLVEFLILPEIQLQFSSRMPSFLLKRLNITASNQNTVDPIYSTQGLPLQFEFNLPSDFEKGIGWAISPLITPFQRISNTMQGDLYMMSLECIINRSTGVLSSAYSQLFLRYLPTITLDTTIQDSWYIFLTYVTAATYARQKGLTDALQAFENKKYQEEKNLMVHEQGHYQLPSRINQLNRLDIKG